MKKIWKKLAEYASKKAGFCLLEKDSAEEINEAIVKLQDARMQIGDMHRSLEAANGNYQELLQEKTEAIQMRDFYQKEMEALKAVNGDIRNQMDKMVREYKTMKAALASADKAPEEDKEGEPKYHKYYSLMIHPIDGAETWMSGYVFASEEDVKKFVEKAQKETVIIEDYEIFTMWTNKIVNCKNMKEGGYPVFDPYEEEHKELAKKYMEEEQEAMKEMLQKSKERITNGNGNENENENDNENENNDATSRTAHGKSKKKPLISIVFDVVRGGAPQFYLTEQSARRIIYWYLSKR